MTEHRIPRRRSKSAQYYRELFLREYIEKPQPRGPGLHRLPSLRPAHDGERRSRQPADPLVLILVLVAAVVMTIVCMLACLTVFGLVF